MYNTNSTNNNSKNTNSQTNNNMNNQKQFWNLFRFNNINECLYNMSCETNGVSDNHLNFIQQQFNSHVVKGNSFLCKGWVNVPSDVIRQVAGTNGKWFKMTTEKQHVLFIWHCTLTKKIKVWGHKYSVINALNVLNKRIQKSCFDLVTSMEINEIMSVIENEYEENHHPFSYKNDMIYNQDIIDFNNSDGLTSKWVADKWLVSV